MDDVGAKWYLASNDNGDNRVISKTSCGGGESERYFALSVLIFVHLCNKRTVKYLEGSRGTERSSSSVILNYNKPIASGNLSTDQDTGCILKKERIAFKGAERKRIVMPQQNSSAALSFSSYSVIPLPMGVVHKSF